MDFDLGFVNSRRELEKEDIDYCYVDQRKKRKLEESLSHKEEKDDTTRDAITRQIFDPVKREFDYSKRRVTDLKENNFVNLPKALDEKQMEN